MDKLSKEKRSKNMSKISNKNTSIEIILCKELWKSGIRYRKNYRKLPGSPDIAITKYKIAVFCDGEFWHGKDWHELKIHLLNETSNGIKWIYKIETNMKRDESVNRELRGLGWYVIRFWGKDIKKDPNNCVRVIKEVIFQIKVEDTIL